MEVTPLLLLALSACVLVVAFLYSSVGHGGASGYLAVLSFFGFGAAAMSTTALILNILVAGMAAYAYYRAGFFSLRLLWPFVVSSIPLAFVGGLIDVPTKTYAFLLALALLFAAFRLIVVVRTQDHDPDTIGVKAPSLGISIPTGGGIGILSGIVGVGGGIFLSPLLILLRWADIKRTSAVSAFFIVVNSISGLVGRSVGGQLEFGSLILLVPAAFVGGLIGSYLGSRRFSGLMLRRMLAVVLLAASVKLILTGL